MNPSYSNEYQYYRGQPPQIPNEHAYPNSNQLYRPFEANQGSFDHLAAYNSRNMEDFGTRNLPNSINYNSGNFDPRNFENGRNIEVRNLQQEHYLNPNQLANYHSNHNNQNFDARNFYSDRNNPENMMDSNLAARNFHSHSPGDLSYRNNLESRRWMGENQHSHPQPREYSNGNYWSNGVNNNNNSNWVNGNRYPHDFGQVVHSSNIYSTVINDRQDWNMDWGKGGRKIWAKCELYPYFENEREKWASHRREYPQNY